MTGQFLKGQSAGTRSHAEQIISDTHRLAVQPSQNTINIAHGYIVDIKEDIRQVRVQDIVNEENLIANGAYLPVLQDELEIQRRWGQLQKGMFCRIFWTGVNRARHVLYVEILSTHFIEIQKEARDNDVDTNPYKILG